MATFFSPNRVQCINVLLKITLANGQGEQTRQMEFTDEQHGRETVAQLADLFLSACDLASAGREFETPNADHGASAGVSELEAMLGCCQELEPGVKRLNDFIITATLPGW